MIDSQPTIDTLLQKLGELRGSDLHIKVGSPPAFRVAGELTMTDFPELSAASVSALADELMTDVERRKLDRHGDVDFSFGRAALGRFRVNVFRQRGSVSIAIRSVGSGTYTFEELGLPPAMEEIARSTSGLVLVTGRAASGKTTTLAALLDHINRTRRVNIVTIEDPIEVLHSDKMGLVSQREVGLDTDTFESGLRQALRQDADVVYVSDLVGPEAVNGAFQLALTGHLVLGAMNTADAEDTVERLGTLFNGLEPARVRRQMAAGITAIVSQKLMSRSDDHGLTPAVEVMINTGLITEALRGTKDLSLREVMADGAYFGMQTFDQSLLKLQQRGLVSFQDALNNATDPQDFKLAVQALGLKSA